VKARFGGAERVFKIPRDKLENFELAIGEPAQVRFRRLVTGTATAEQVREVLELSAPRGLGQKLPESKVEADTAAMWLALKRSAMAHVGSDSFVAKAIAQKPPARFGLLAQGVLAACLYGLPAEAAFFDEDDDGADAPASPDAQGAGDAE